jgi:predicted aldo/keto reductase-like oxidoreductase
MADPSLTDTEKEYLQKQAILPGYYCQGCEQSLAQCSARIPIPDLMRAYMYTYGYRDIKQEYDLITSLDLPRSICQDCGQCSVKCSIGFDVPAKIRKIARLRDVPSEFIV